MRQEKRTVSIPMLLMLALAVYAISAAIPKAALAGKAGLLVTVDISPALRAGTSPEQVVFIYARAARGPRAPLAAVKAQVKDLPFTVTLDDSKALTPMFRLSNFKDVQVSARVSQSGQATRGSGDLEGVSREITLGDINRPVRVTIDHIVP